MTNHFKLYLDAFDYDISDTILCELTGMVATDIHHIQRRGMGGDNTMNRIENLMALSREAHLKYGDVVSKKAYLYRVHKRNLEACGIEFDEAWINQQIEKYENFESDLEAS